MICRRITVAVPPPPASSRRHAHDPAAHTRTPPSPEALASRRPPRGAPEHPSGRPSRPALVPSRHFPRPGRWPQAVSRLTESERILKF